MHGGSHRFAPPDRGCVVIVDDDDEARAVTADALGRLGRAIFTTSSGEAALELAVLERPAAVITEVLLPAMSGYELCRALKESYGDALAVVFRSESPPEPRSRLTQREAEVLDLLIDGLHQTQIAEQLVIAPRTVGKHVEHILAKFGVQTRAQAVALALRGSPVTRARAARNRDPKRVS
jgi:DNA-binding NarL/FixJ family response regulator